MAGVGSLHAQTVPPDSVASRVDSLATRADSLSAPADTPAVAPVIESPATGADALAQVVALEDKRRKAMVAADVTTLTGIIMPDATYVHGTGIMQTRDELLRLLANKTIVYKSFDIEKTAYRVYGTTIVGTGVQRITVMAGGKSRVIHSRYTVVYAERDGTEKLIAYQSTPLPEMTSTKK
jgi:hypothetical protein